MNPRPTCLRCHSSSTGDWGSGPCPACLLEFGLVGYPPPNTDESESSAEPTGERIGDYELLEVIGRGGMGVVYRARQAALDRVVAVKLISTGLHAREEDLRRFQTEARSAAQLRHPNIVTVHEIGRSNGQPFLAMEYIQGRDLSDVIRQSPLPPEGAAACLKTLASAVQHAHERGVLHRDLKPSNILIDAAGAPHLLDFGLAKSFHEDSGITTTGAIMGSPSYMAPEQTREGRGEIGPATDIYALGAVCYEMLTGRPPFRAATAIATLRLVVEEEPVSPRQLNPQLPTDLETICLKCLAKTPGRRYSTAADVASELDRFLRHEPILARPIPATARAWRWCQRKPVVAGLSLALGLSVVSAAVISTALAVRLKHSRDEVAFRAAQVQEKSRELSERLVQLSVVNGLDLVNADKATDALPWLVEALRLAAGNPTNEASHRLRLAALTQGMPRPIQSWFLEGPPQQVRFESNNGVSASTPTEGGFKRRYFAVDRPDPTRETIESENPPGSAHPPRRPTQAPNTPPRELSPSGRQVATVESDRYLTLRDAQSNQALSPRLDHGSAIRDIKYSADGLRVLVRTWETVRIWDTIDHEYLAAIRHPYLTTAAIDATGERVLTGAADGAVQVWQLPPELPPVHRDATRPSKLVQPASPDGRFELRRDSQGRHWVRDLISQRSEEVPWPHPRPITSASWCAAKRELVIIDAQAEGWLLPAGQPAPRQILSQAPPHAHIVFGNTGSHWVVWSDDPPGINLYHLDQPSLPLARLPAPPGTRSVVFDPLDQQLAVGNADGTVRFWDSRTGEPRSTSISHGGPLSHLAFSADGSRLVTAGDDGYARSWVVQTGAPMGRPLFQGNPVMGLAVSPDARRVATLTIYGARVWDTATGLSLTPVLIHPAPISTALFSADTLRLVTGSAQDRPHLWDIRTGLWLAAPSESRLAWVDPPSSLSEEAHSLPLPWLGRIPIPDHSVEELQHHAAVTSGRQLDGAGGLVPIETTRLVQAWSTLRQQLRGESLQ